MLKRFSLLVPLGALLISTAGPASALERRTEQSDARARLTAGETKTLRSLENRAISRMRGSEYIGFNYFQDQAIYRFRFIRDGRVRYVDMDGRTGRVLDER